MNITELQYFSAVYETLNYTVAAKKIHISRQALKKAISKLEEETGSALFVSFKNQLHSTSAANYLYSHSRVLLNEFHRLTSSAINKRIGFITGHTELYTDDELLTNNIVNNKNTYISGSNKKLTCELVNGALDVAFLLSN